MTYIDIKINKIRFMTFYIYIFVFTLVGNLIFWMGYNLLEDNNINNIISVSSLLLCIVIIMSFVFYDVYKSYIMKEKENKFLPFM